MRCADGSRERETISIVRKREGKRQRVRVCVRERERETSDKEEAREGRRIEESKGLKIGGEWGERVE